MLVKGGQKMGGQPLTSKALNRQFCNYGKNSEGAFLEFVHLVVKCAEQGCPLLSEDVEYE